MSVICDIESIFVVYIKMIVKYNESLIFIGVFVEFLLIILVFLCWFIFSFVLFLFVVFVFVLCGVCCVFDKWWVKVSKMLMFGVFCVNLVNMNDL